jgi:photosystem II stability/assembly factor-like uncharacterized protein
VVGWRTQAWHYLNGAWSSVVVASGAAHLQAVAMPMAGEAWAVGGGILHYTGGTWTPVAKPNTFGLLDIAMVSPREGWAVGVNGAILHYTGGAWSLLDPSPTNKGLSSIAMVSPSEGWAVGDGGAILHYVWESWRVVTGG